jgi:hypothetical protein
MKSRWMPIMMAALAICGNARAHAADLRPAIVTNLTGTLDVEQDVPCGGHSSSRSAVTGGRIELVPAEGLERSGNLFFVLSRMNVKFDDFSTTASCGAFSDTESYSQVSAHLARTVGFTATPAGGGAFTFTIPKASVLFEVIDVRNGALERRYTRPSQDVTGSIDPTSAAFHVHVVLSQAIHVKAGCVADACIIDETDRGTMTADVSGTILYPDSDRDGVPDRSDNCVFFPNPDQSPITTPTVEAPADVTLSCGDRFIGRATGKDVCDGRRVTITNDAPLRFPVGSTIVTWTAMDSKGRTATDAQTVTVIDNTKPTVSCTATHPLGTSFVVRGSDVCGAVALTLGSYTIGNGETIKIEETGQPGVRLQNVVGKDGIRKFLVGKAEAAILATDGSGNTATAVCR